MTATPAEYSLSIASMVDTIQEAFQFVMEHLDELGDNPRITINPVWSYTDSEHGVRRFDVGVSGTPAADRALR